MSNSGISNYFPDRTEIVKFWHFAQADTIRKMELIEFHLDHVHVADSSETEPEGLRSDFDVEGKDERLLDKSKDLDHHFRTWRLKLTMMTMTMRSKHHSPLVADFAAATQWFPVETLLDRIYAENAPDIQPTKDMHYDGSTILPGLFSWLGEDLDGVHPDGLWPLIHQEFRMYHYHLSESTKELG